MVPCPTGRTREETERIMRNRKDGNPARPAAPVVHAEPWGGGGALRDAACRRSAPRCGCAPLDWNARVRVVDAMAWSIHQTPACPPHACISGASVQSHVLAQSDCSCLPLAWLSPPGSVPDGAFSTDTEVCTCVRAFSTYYLNYLFRSWLLITVATEPPRGGRRSTPAAVRDLD
jgi:hypothetical protein